MAVTDGFGEKLYSAPTTVQVFAALTPSQRAEIMKHYKKDGSVR